MKLPEWVHHPKQSIKASIPTKEEIAQRILSSRKGRIGLVGVVYGLLFGVYMAGQIPYPASGENGYVAFYTMSETQRGALGWFMIGGVPSYLISEKVISMVYSPDKNRLLQLDPEGRVLHMWELGDEKLADMTVEDGELATRDTNEGKVWLCVEYDPEENRARATWEGTVDAGQVWSTKQNVAECINETQDRARDADRLERRQPEIIRKSVKHELKDHVEMMDRVDPVVSGEGYKEARRDVLGIEYEEDGTERDEQLRKQKDEKDRKDTNGKGDVDELEAFGASEGDE